MKRLAIRVCAAVAGCLIIVTGAFGGYHLFVWLNESLSPSKGIQDTKWPQGSGTGDEVSQEALQRREGPFTIDPVGEIDYSAGDVRLDGVLSLGTPSEEPDVVIEWDPGSEAYLKLRDLDKQVGSLVDIAGDVLDRERSTLDRLLWLEETVGALQAQILDMQEEKP